MASWEKFLREITEAGILDNFPNETKNETKIEYCKGNKQLCKIVRGWIESFNPKQHQKSKANAMKAKLDGNACFQKKDFEGAFQFYTKCIMNAPFDCDEECLLSVGYANRSAAAFHLNKFEICLDDIGNAFLAGYASDFHYKLYHRKGMCMFKLNNFKIAAETLEEALHQLKINESLPIDKKELLTKDIINSLAKSKSLMNSKVNTKREEFKLPSLTYGENKYVNSASESLDVRLTDKGRSVMSNRPIKAGDVLIVEKPFASVLLPEYFESRCHFCHGFLKSPIPCRMCSQVLYCSFDCQNESWTRFHFLECSRVDLLCAIGIAYLSLRVVLNAGIPFILSNSKKIQEIDSDRIVSSGDYFSVYSLVSHSSDMKKDDVFCYTLTSVLLLFLMRNAASEKKEQKLEVASNSSSFEKKFQSENVDQLSTILTMSESDEIFIGSLFLHHIMQLICNAHAIAELQSTKLNSFSPVEKEEQVRIASAFYSTASLINHSCEPNVILSYQRNILIVKCIKDIPSGSEVLNCYGPHFARQSFEDRQSALKEQYFFTCACEKCELEKVDAVSYKSFNCPECDGRLKYHVETDSSSDTQKCEHCGKVLNCQQLLHNIIKATQLEQEAANHLNAFEYTDAVKCLQQCIELRKLCVHKFHPDMAIVHDMLAQCYAQQGEFRKCLDLLRISMKTVEAQYGCNSIEYANEIQKFTDIIIQVLMDAQSQNRENIRAYALEMVKMLDLGLDIFKKHYSEEHESMKEMMQKKEFIEKVLKTF